MITRAYQPYTLVGPPVRGLVLDPLAVYSSRTVYTSPHIVLSRTATINGADFYDTFLPFTPSIYMAFALTLTISQKSLKIL